MHAACGHTAAAAAGEWTHRRAAPVALLAGGALPPAEEVRSHAPAAQVLQRRSLVEQRAWRAQRGQQIWAVQIQIATASTVHDAHDLHTSSTNQEVVCEVVGTSIVRGLMGRHAPGNRIWGKGLMPKEGASSQIARGRHHAGQLPLRAEVIDAVHEYCSHDQRGACHWPGNHPGASHLSIWPDAILAQAGLHIPSPWLRCCTFLQRAKPCVPLAQRRDVAQTLLMQHQIYSAIYCLAVEGT